MEFYIIVFASLLCFNPASKAEQMKCWFGQPHTNTSYSCYDSSVTSGSCPAKYICVVRHKSVGINKTELWRGCCPEGDGPCHKEIQPIDPADSAIDITPPSCDDSGYYKPRQCGFAGCNCALPNGTFITKLGDTQINCTEAVKRIIGSQSSTLSPTPVIIPSLCNLPAETGPCRALFRPWYFNSQTQECEQFIYGGCAGNDNRFEDKKACENMCGSKQKTCPGNLVWNDCGSACTNTCEKKNQPCILMCQPRCECPRDKPLLYKGNCIEESLCPKVETTTLSSSITTENIPAFCHLPADSGPCEALARLWYFNTNTKQCERFNYGGCQGNKNQFSTKTTCEMTCGVRKTCPMGQIWNDCGSPCTRTCETKTHLCIETCQSRCECPHDKPLLHEGHCIEECPAKSEIFKCHFGQPLEKGTKGCPSDYISVVRHNSKPGGQGNIFRSWEGCCPRGKGPCEEERQRMETPGIVSDQAPPGCDVVGDYLPMQCNMAGCSCVMPKGEYIKNSHQFWDKDNNQERCNHMVKKALGTCGSACTTVRKSHVVVIAVSVTGTVFLIGLVLAIYFLVNSKGKSMNKKDKDFHYDKIVEVKIPNEKN